VQSPDQIILATQSCFGWVIIFLILACFLAFSGVFLAITQAHTTFQQTIFSKWRKLTNYFVELHAAIE
jgi:hypothetical protein